MADRSDLNLGLMPLTARPGSNERNLDTEMGAGGGTPRSSEAKPRKRKRSRSSRSQSEISLEEIARTRNRISGGRLRPFDPNGSGSGGPSFPDAGLPGFAQPEGLPSLPTPSPAVGDSILDGI